MNNVHFVGNVGQHPTLRETKGGTPVANVTLATNRFYRDREGQRQQATEWHRLVVWGEAARTFARIVAKGDLLAVRGRLEYKTREIAGEKVLDATLRVLEWTKLSPRKANEPAEEAEPAATAGEGHWVGDGDSAEEDIPF
jgi:single-strand DNA-binding protein